VRIVPDVAVSGANANPGIVDGLLGLMLRNQANGTEASITKEKVGRGVPHRAATNRQAVEREHAGNRRARLIDLRIMKRKNIGYR